MKFSLKLFFISLIPKPRHGGIKGLHYSASVMDYYEMFEKVMVQWEM